MIQQVEITLPSYERGFHIITADILQALDNLPQTGLLHLFIKHTSAGIGINENADPTVLTDLNNWFDRNIKENEPYYLHNYEGSDDMPAHIKSMIVGSSVQIPITESRMNLGIWQGIYLGEFRNRGGRRKIIATIYS